MVIRQYSVSKDGSTQLSSNFKVKEFRCKDGADMVLVADKLVEVLQAIRDHYGKAVVINSAYRTQSHNAAVGGSSKSQHMAGTAADIQISGVSPLEVARYAERLMPDTGGIGLYQTFTHVDVRAKRTRWDSTSGTEKSVSGFSVDYADEVQKRFGFETQTMIYLKEYKYADDLLEKLATKA